MRHSFLAEGDVSNTSVKLRDSRFMIHVLQNIVLFKNLIVRRSGELIV